MFGRINAIEDQCARRRFPVSFTRNNLYRTILISNAKVHAESRTVTPSSFVEVPCSNGLMIEPSITQQYADGILSFLQMFRNIKCQIKILPVETSVQRIQTMITYLLSIQIKFEQTCNYQIGSSRLDFLLCLELFSEIRSRFIIDAVIIANPCTLPVLHIHHPSFEATNS